MAVPLSCVHNLFDAGTLRAAAIREHVDMLADEVRRRIAAGE